MKANKKIYFASDFHLGVPSKEDSLIREKKIVKWLDEIKSDAEEIYLMGDLFDFWFEYKYTVPKGFVRLLGKIAEIVDSGIPVILFTGNHDMWMFDYLPQEIGVSIYRDPITRTYNGKKFYLGHGDGLGPGDHGYKFIKRVFANPVCQWLFERLHPNFALRIANYWSHKSRISNAPKDEQFKGEDGEWLVSYSKDVLKKEHFDYFIFGHRHLPLDIKLSDNSRYINLGEWVNHYSYAVFDGEKLELKYYSSDKI
ncbi:MAG TPA: UDP-2,3-diacylglucosamine diphosphatase [Bacteroidia bacterium]|nr:UDP-2,3-diacylglucosamine diphosphatase [Bacteroidia bacterium]